MDKYTHTHRERERERERETNTHLSRHKHTQNMPTRMLTLINMHTYTRARLMGVACVCGSLTNGNAVTRKFRKYKTKSGQTIRKHYGLSTTPVVVIKL